jgi:hypothetical protein
MTPPRARPGEPPPVDDRVRVTDVEFCHPGQPERQYLKPGEPLEVRAHYEVDAPVQDPVFTLMIHDADGKILHASSTSSESMVTGELDGPGDVVFAFERMPVHNGQYAVTMCVTSSDGAYIYDWHEQRYRFEVRDPERSPEPGEFPVKISIDKRSAPRPAIR